MDSTCSEIECVGSIEKCWPKFEKWQVEPDVGVLKIVT